MWLRVFLVAMVAALLSACAAPPKLTPSDEPQWSGRISIKVDADPVQQTSAAFTLVGTVMKGELNLFNPLGGKAAQLTWQPNGAHLSNGSQGRDYPDLDTALLDVTKTSIPVNALFDWLQGKQDKALEAAIGWEVDLTRFADGHIHAIRLTPAPRVDLRVVLEK